MSEDRSSQDQQKELILSQFSRQAIPFSEMPGHSDQSAFELLLKASGVTPGDTVLDVACGPGLVTLTFAQVARHVTGIDITPAMIERAKELQRQKGLANLTWQVGDVLPLPYGDNSFSMVVTRYSFHHFLDPKAVLLEMTRVCSPGGKVMVIDAAPSTEKAEGYNKVEKLRDPSHTKALTPQELIGMAVEVGLTDVNTEFYKVEMDLERQIASSFPNEGDDDKIRQLLREDLGSDKLGLGAHLKGDRVWIAYPTLVVVGRKEA